MKKALVKRWISFLMAISLLTGVVYFLPAGLNEIPAYRHFSQHVRDKHIHTTAIFYSEVPETYEAEKILEKAIQQSK